MTDSDVPLPEGDDPKEVFAFYCLAMYQAQVLETALLTLLVALEASGSAAVTRAEIDAWFVRHETKTFGNLLNGVRGLTSICAPILSKLGVNRTLIDSLMNEAYWRARAADTVAV